MDELIAEFKALVDQLPNEGGLATSIGLLLQQMEARSAKLLKLCAIPHQFDLAILNILAPDLDTAEAEKKYIEFSELSLVKKSQEGLALHDEARAYLFSEWLKPQNVLEFTAVNARLSTYFEQCMAGASSEALENLEPRWMFHLLGAKQAEGFREFERLFRKMHYQFRLSQCQSLVQLVHEYDPILEMQYARQLAYQEGKLAIDLYHLDSAEKLFTRILDDNDSDPELKIKSYNRLGIVYAMQRYWSAAIDSYQKALQLANIIGYPRI